LTKDFNSSISCSVNLRKGVSKWEMKRSAHREGAKEGPKKAICLS
jgi:hypothetical protein